MPVRMWLAGQALSGICSHLWNTTALEEDSLPHKAAILSLNIADELIELEAITSPCNPPASQK